MANAFDSDSKDWRFDPSRADQNRRKHNLLPAAVLLSLQQRINENGSPNRFLCAVTLPGCVIFGGREGSRTLDLCNANAALSQLSYAPVRYI